MPENNKNQNEFNDSLYQNDKEQKPMKLIVMVLLILLILGGALFLFLRKKDKVIESRDMARDPDFTSGQEDKPFDVAQDSAVALKKLEEQLAQFADDKDRDGLSAEKEKELGTSDNDSDTDWDGVSDKDEIEKWGTDPLKVDTDGDGFSDGFEINGGFNPKGTGKL